MSKSVAPFPAHTDTLTLLSGAEDAQFHHLLLVIVTSIGLISYLLLVIDRAPSLPPRGIASFPFPAVDVCKRRAMLLICFFFCVTTHGLLLITTVPAIVTVGLLSL